MKPMHDSIKMFKPFSRGGFLQSETGMNLFKRVASGESDIAEREFVRILKSGDNSFISGIGPDITSEMDDLADVVKVVTQNNPKSAGLLADDIRASVAVMEKELFKLGKQAETSALRANARKFESLTRRIEVIQKRKNLLRNLADRALIVAGIRMVSKAVGQNRGGGSNQ